MKTIIFSFVLILSVSINYTLNAQTPTELSFVQTIQPENSQIAFINLNGFVELKVWDKDYMLLRTNVTCPQLNRSTISDLAQAGRYNITSKVDFNNFMHISQPLVEQPIGKNYKHVLEKLSYVLYVPADLEIEIDNLNDLVENYEPESKLVNVDYLGY